MPRILITGAAGRVGRLLTPLLRESFALRLLDVQPVPSANAADEVMQGDLANPETALLAVKGVDGVVHLAGLVASLVSFDDCLSGNYRAVLSVLEACRVHNVRRFVFASSHHIVGMYPSDRTYDEAAVIAPDSHYGLAKAFGEAACAMYAYRYDIATLVIRIGNADPKVVDARRERLWVSGRDLCQLVTIGLTHRGLRYEIVNGVSQCPNPQFSLDAAEWLGYRPRDHASEHRADDFRSVEQLTDADGYGYAGGRFAVDPLPSPFDVTGT